MTGAHEECARCGVVGPGRFRASPATDVHGLGEFAVSRADLYRRVSFGLDDEPNFIDTSIRALMAERRGGLSRCRRLASVLAARLVLA